MESNKAISLKRHEAEMATVAAELNRLAMQNPPGLEFPWAPGAGIGIRLSVREADFQHPEKVAAMLESLKVVFRFFGYQVETVTCWDQLVETVIAEEELRSRIAMGGDVPSWL